MRKKIKIAHFIPSLRMGGAENVVVDFCRFSDKNKFQTYVIYWEDREDLLEKLSGTGTIVEKISFDKVVSLRSIIKLASFLKKNSIDILHTHLMDPDLLGFFAAKISGVPQVLSIHSYPFPKEKRHRIRYKVMSFGIKKIICVSRTVERHVSSSTGIPTAKLEVVHNGIDVEKFSRERTEAEKREIKGSLGISTGLIVVGNVSRLIPDKGHECLIKAAPKILERFPGIVFLIVGDGRLRKDLEALVSSLGLAEKFIFTGTRNDVPSLLSIMDVFVFPTFHESMGLSVLEAMAAARPIVATNDVAVIEIMDDPREGFLIKAGDVDAIARSVISLLNHPSDAEKMGRLARVRAKNFSIGKMVSRYEDVYYSTLGIRNVPEDNE